MTGDRLRQWMNVVPALVSFGPLLMIIGLDSPYRVESMIGALVTAVGILIIFANVMAILNAASPVTASPISQRRGWLTAVVLGGVGVAALIVAGVLLSRPHV